MANDPRSPVRDAPVSNPQCAAIAEARTRRTNEVERALRERALPGRQRFSRDLIAAEAEDVALTTDLRLLRDRLRFELGDRYHVELMAALTRRSYPPGAARVLWERVRLHKACMTEQLGRNPGIHVAALDYLLNIEKNLEAPVVVNENTLRALEEGITRDPLTGLYDRMALDCALERTVERALAEGRSLSLLLFDVDHFKRVNDEHGHLEGDRVLVEVARLVQSNVRDTDLACRYGGEEMAVLAPNTAPAEALRLAERVRTSVATLCTRPITLSAGIAVLPGAAMTAQGLVRAADHALYESKRRGRNRSTLRSGRSSQASLRPSTRESRPGDPRGTK